MVHESDSAIHRDGKGRKLHHERYTGPWEVQEVLMTGLSVKVVMQGRKLRVRTVATSEVKPFHVRPLHLRHSIADEFAQYVWGPDWKTSPTQNSKPTFVTLVDRREVQSETGTKQWEYKARTAEGKVSRWLPEASLRESFTHMELDAFHALWHLYYPTPASLTSRPRKYLSRADALKLFPLGTTFWKNFKGTLFQGQVFDYGSRYWKVRYPDGDWEELTRTELERLTQKGGGKDQTGLIARPARS